MWRFSGSGRWRAIGISWQRKHIIVSVFRSQTPTIQQFYMQNIMIDTLLKLPRPVKRIAVISVDVIACVLSAYLAYALRVGDFPDSRNQGVEILAIWSATATVGCFLAFGLYRSIFRHVSWYVLRPILFIIILVSVPPLALFTMVSVEGVPRTLPVLQPMVLLLLIWGSRGLLSALVGAATKETSRKKSVVMIYGAGDAGRQLCSGLMQSGDVTVVGFVDDDSDLIGQQLFGKRIFDAENLADLREQFGITDVLLALPSAGRQRRGEIIAKLRKMPLHVRTLPSVSELASGKVVVADLRELDIEDLLGRDVVPPNEVLLAKNILRKTVCVTGAGGSIGSELCRQIATIGPKILILIENSEFALYKIHRELSAFEGLHPKPLLVPILASVTDDTRLDTIFREWQIDTVYHTAAYKHVPLVEENPIAGIENNVFGTLTAAICAERHGVANFVLISTDKAVRPANVMGASKRVAELVLQALAARKGTTRFSMVRFGNVLGSSGSVVPLFRQQINEGGPVTVTHPEIIRYFMTIPEAAQLVIQAGAMAVGGEVFVLDMGEPIKIIDLARSMIELYGLTVRDHDNLNGDIEIVTVGLRPGEKLFEELLIGNNPEHTFHPRIMKANEEFICWENIEKQLDRLRHLALGQSSTECLRMLKELVPEFRPEARQEIKG